MKLHPVCWHLLIVLLTVPFLTPCTLGVGTGAAALVDKMSDGLSSNNAYAHLPNKDLREWAVRPGPSFKVYEHVAMGQEALVTDDELKGALIAPRPARLGNAARTAANGLSGLLAVTDLMTAAMAQDFTGLPSASRGEDRCQLVLCEKPFILLQGLDLVYRADGNPKQVVVARASKCARITVITPDGSFFALANRIHYDHTRSEILLEGQPSLHSGDQWIKSAHLHGWMKLDVSHKSVALNGAAAE